MTEPSKAVFVSYASQNTEAARRLAEALRAGGVEVWLDTTELRGGDVWDVKIQRQIKSCALFIPIISRTTDERREGYFRLEWKLAVERMRLLSDRQAFLLPVVIDPLSDREADVPDAFRNVQWTRLPQGETPPAFVERIKAMLAPANVHVEPARSVSPPLAPIISPPIPANSRGKLSPVSIGLYAALGAVFVFIGWQQFKGARPTIPAATIAATTPSAAPTSAVIPAERSVAVLPFVNESSNQEQEYFADGLTETMIGLLSKVPDLRVPARSASFHFKGKNEELSSIAAKLHVVHLLEGTVRKAGNHLRISADLIRADTGYHVWSETYDRNASDVFKVQDEISAAVVAALKLKLVAAGTNTKVRGTSNVEAYNAYLIGMHYTHQILLGADESRRVVTELRKAVALDPDYADAAAELVLAEAYLADLSADAPGLKRALEAAERLPLEHPDHGPSYRIRGAIRANWQWAGADALADYEKALALDPSDADARYDASIALMSLGRFPEAMTAVQQALTFDPLNTQYLGLLTDIQMALGDYAAADQSLSRIGEIEPHSEILASTLSTLRLLQGRFAESLAECTKIHEERNRLVCVAEAQHSLGHRVEADQAFADLLKTGTRGNLANLALVSGWFGNADEAFAWYDKAVAARETGITQIIGDRTQDVLHTDPRWHALLKKIHLAG